MFREFRHFRHRIIGQLQPPPNLRTCIFTSAWHVFVQGIPILCLAIHVPPQFVNRFYVEHLDRLLSFWSWVGHQETEIPKLSKA